MPYATTISRGVMNGTHARVRAYGIHYGPYLPTKSLKRVRTPLL